MNQGERRLIWLRAENISWREVARRTGFPKTSAQRYHLGGLEKIVLCLNEVSHIPLSRVSN